MKTKTKKKTKERTKKFICLKYVEYIKLWDKIVNIYTIFLFLLFILKWGTLYLNLQLATYIVKELIY